MKFRHHKRNYLQQIVANEPYTDGNNFNTYMYNREVSSVNNNSNGYWGKRKEKKQSEK